MEPTKRLQALDVFRGLTIAFMILVNCPGNGETTYRALLHAAWHGNTPTDEVFGGWGNGGRRRFRGFVAAGGQKQEQRKARQECQELHIVLIEKLLEFYTGGR